MNTDSDSKVKNYQRDNTRRSSFKNSTYKNENLNEKNIISINANDTCDSENKYMSNNKTKQVVWDEKTLEEQEAEKQRNPKKKIDEPKTPYLLYEAEDDDGYIAKLNEINKVKPTVRNS